MNWFKKWDVSHRLFRTRGHYPQLILFDLFAYYQDPRMYRSQINLSVRAVNNALTTDLLPSQRLRKLSWTRCVPLSLQSDACTHTSYQQFYAGRDEPKALPTN